VVKAVKEAKRGFKKGPAPDAGKLKPWTGENLIPRERQLQGGVADPAWVQGGISDPALQVSREKYFRRNARP
jgi:hypothetical protein